MSEQTNVNHQVLAGGPKGRIIEDAVGAIQGRAAVLAVALRGVMAADDGHVPEGFERGVDELLADIDRHGNDIMEAAGFMGRMSTEEAARLLLERGVTAESFGGDVKFGGVK
jgi:hypothetical protein